MRKTKELFSLLKKEKKTIALCESVTAGLASYLLTRFCGASQIFKLGIAAYSLEAKNKLFGIPQKELKETQGVSEGIAKILAEKIRKLINSDIGASIVGFAGPKAKRGMKGIIFVGFSDKNKTVVKKIKLKGERNTIRKKSALFLIEFILENLKQ